MNNADREILKADRSTACAAWTARNDEAAVLQVERNAARAHVERLALVLAAERLDPAAARPGWKLCGRQWVRNPSVLEPGEVTVGCIAFPLAGPNDPRPVRYMWRLYPRVLGVCGTADTALEAMEAADTAANAAREVVP